MAKLIRKEKNIVYEYYEVEITEEQANQFRNDDESFMDEIYNDRLSFEYEDKVDGSSRVVYYIKGDQEPILD